MLRMLYLAGLWKSQGGSWCILCCGWFGPFDCSCCPRVDTSMLRENYRSYCPEEAKGAMKHRTDLGLGATTGVARLAKVFSD